jgi:hypothetical protein
VHWFGVAGVTRLVAQDSKGGERDGYLDDDRAERQEPNFALRLPIHVFPG